MKNLKKSCHSLIQKQLLNPVDETSVPSHSLPKEESYAKGTASFQEVYRYLPDVFSDKMKDSLSPSVALYAVLHLANDMKLRLIPQVLDVEV
ncbi:GL24564 [Drosophila persimilis]|uniref:Condensin complex subunit 2 n=2 Tax=Drosophila persimilis TaxID=7234 RepID=B4IRC8_DROPE|nr:GL24564 [Drosophila persimilis]